MYQRVLVPFDGSPPSARGLNEAIKFAKAQGGSSYGPAMTSACEPR